MLRNDLSEVQARFRGKSPGVSFSHHVGTPKVIGGNAVSYKDCLLPVTLSCVHKLKPRAGVPFLDHVLRVASHPISCL